jgi:urease accessory protein
VHDTALLQLLHLSDSALPIGSAAHSFGLETLAEEGDLRPEGLEGFFQNHLEETGTLDATFVARAWLVEVNENDDAHSLAFSLSDELSARRPARESREASLKLGRRFAELVNALLRRDAIGTNLHHSVAFGVAGRVLAIPEQAVVLAYLQQSIAGLISACQRLMPLGQVAANRILWNLKPAMAQVATRAIARATTQAMTRARMVASSIEEISCFQPLPELASIRHGARQGSTETRLFIS